MNDLIKLVRLQRRDRPQTEIKKFGETNDGDRSAVTVLLTGHEDEEPSIPQR